MPQHPLYVPAAERMLPLMSLGKVDYGRRDVHPGDLYARHSRAILSYSAIGLTALNASSRTMILSR